MELHYVVKKELEVIYIYTCVFRDFVMNFSIKPMYVEVGIFFLDAIKRL